MRIQYLAIAALFAMFVSPAAHAQSGNIQLMPPTFFGTTTPCVSSTAANNQVLFLGSTGQAGQSAINCLTGNGFVVDAANGRVGIGNATPQTPLDVTGPVRTNDAATVCSAAVGGSIRYNTTTNVFEGCVDLGGGNWQWQNFGIPSCGGIPGVATSSAVGVTCQPICPAGNVPAYATSVTMPTTATAIGEQETANDSSNCNVLVFQCGWNGWQIISATPTGGCP